VGSFFDTHSAPSTRSLASAPLDSEGARVLLQQRVSLLARVVVLLGLLIQALVRWVAFSAKTSPLAVAISWTPNIHLVVLAAGGAIWWRTRSGRRSARELAWLDVGCALGPFAFASVALWYASPLVRPNLIHVLGTGNLLILRGVLVPSSGRRTLLIGLGFSAAIVAWTYAYYARLGASAASPPLLFSVATLVWCLMSVTISGVASHTIFGLRRRVREATQLGQYLLIRKIGAGGMGVVFEARHALLRRRTALKLLPLTQTDERNAARFEREVRLTSTLTHPNTISIYDYGRSPDGVFYYAMEYLDGIDLQKLVDGAGAQPSAIVAHILEQVCGALSEAHAAGLIHRDIKPANVILCERGGTPAVAKVVDFGLVKALESADGAPEATSAQSLVGTPLYMSPEAIRSPDRVDARSDLYAVGAVGYFLVTGQHVFGGKTTVEVCAHHLHSAPLPPSQRVQAPVDGALEAILLECLAKEPAQRPASAKQLGERLAAVRSGSGLSPAAIEEWWQRVKPARDGSAAAAAGSLAAPPPAASASGLPGSAHPAHAATTVLEIDLGQRGD
jgi:tRNA A-37 threonylcarbamoyl transferase component Bud32